MDRFRPCFKKLGLTLVFASIVFLILLATMALMFLSVVILTTLGFINHAELSRIPLFLFAISSVAVGTILAIMFSKKPLKPFRDFMAAIDRSLDLYANDREAWNELAANDMELEVSWKAPAQEYMEMFRKVIG